MAVGGRGRYIARYLMVKEMCTASYRATQKPGKVTISARGTHNKTGYRVSFERVGVTVFPPQFSFMHEAPEGAAVMVPSEFEHKLTFVTDRKIDSIVIYDAKGRHEIDVTQISDSHAEPQRAD